MGKIKTFILGICLLLGGLTAGYAGALNLSGEERELCRAKVARVYTHEIGVRELTGQNDGPRIDAYLAVTGFTDNHSYRIKTGKGYAWCAAFVSWSFEQAGVKALKNAWAPAWFTPEATIYKQGKGLKPARADVFGIYSAKNKLIHHVGFIDDWPQGDYAITVEGNTNNAGSNEGDGVYRKRRLKVNIYKVSRWV